MKDQDKAMRLLLKAHSDVEAELHLARLRNKQLQDRIAELEQEISDAKDTMIEIMSRKLKLRKPSTQNIA